jgi:hypothetical protein
MTSCESFLALGVTHDHDRDLGATVSTRAQTDRSEQAGATVLGRAWRPRKDTGECWVGVGSQHRIPPLSQRARSAGLGLDLRSQREGGWWARTGWAGERYRPEDLPRGNQPAVRSNGALIVLALRDGHPGSISPEPETLKHRNSFRPSQPMVRPKAPIFEQTQGE